MIAMLLGFGAQILSFISTNAQAVPLPLSLPTPLTAPNGGGPITGTGSVV